MSRRVGADDHPADPEIRSLIGKSVTLTISEPWDFGTVHGNGPFAAAIVDVTPNHDSRGPRGLLVRLAKPLWYQGNVCEYMIATPRASGDDLGKLARNEGVSCGFVSISPRGAKSTTPFDLTWWRGWGALLGVVHTVHTGDPTQR